MFIDRFYLTTGAGSVICLPQSSGCSSVVERDLAKVEVEGSNPFTRSDLQDSDSGPQPTNCGLFVPKAGQGQEDAEIPPVESRTEATLPPEAPRTPESHTKRIQSADGNEEKSADDPALALLASAWPRIPKKVQETIVALVTSFAESTPDSKDAPGIQPC